MPYGKRRLFYKCYSLWLKFISLKGNPRLLLRRWWWIISFGGLLQGPESGTWLSLHSAPAAFCFSRARLPPAWLLPSFFLPLPPRFSSPRQRKPLRSERRLTAPARRLDASRSRKWEVPLEFVWPPPRECEPGNFSTEKVEAFEVGRVRLSEWGLQQLPSDVTRDMEDEQTLQPGDEAVAPARRASPGSECGDEAQRPNPEVRIRPRSPELRGFPAGTAACAPWDPSPGRLPWPQLREPFSGDSCHWALSSPRYRLEVSHQPRRTECANWGFRRSGWEFCSKLAELIGYTVAIVIPGSPSL